MEVNSGSEKFKVTWAELDRYPIRNKELENKNAERKKILVLYPFFRVKTRNENIRRRITETEAMICVSPIIIFTNNLRIDAGL